MPRNEFFRDFIVTSPEGIWVDGRAYATLNAAVAAVGANEQTIVIASEQVITTITIPVNVTLKFERNGSISNSAAMIILTTKIIAPNRQIFTGVGNIAFSWGSELRSSWFASFEEAVTRIAHADVTLIVSEPRLVAADCTVGAYTSLKWESPNAMLTVNPGTTVDGLQHIEAGSFQIFAGAGTFTFDDHCQLKLSWFPRLRSAITWIDTSEVVLHIDGTHIVDFSDTAPANISFDFKTARGHIEVLVGLLLIIKGDVYGGFFRIFSGDGTVICPRGFNVTAIRMASLLGGTLDFGDVWPGNVSLQGFYEPGDDGGGEFHWDSLELKDNHNGGTIIDPHHTALPGAAAWYAGVGIGGTGCWKRDSDNEERNVKWFGATGDGVLSDRLSILSTINSISGGGQIYFPPGTYIIDSSLDISAHTDINFSFSGGASLSLSVGVILTLPSPDHIIASANQHIFSGGTISFGSGGTVYPDWWAVNTTPGTTDMGAAYRAALGSVVGVYGKVKFLGSTYRIIAGYEVTASNSVVALEGACERYNNLFGATTNSRDEGTIVILDNANLASYFLLISNHTALSVKNIEFRCAQEVTNRSFFKIDNYVMGFNFEDVTFYNVERPVVFTNNAYFHNGRFQKVLFRDSGTIHSEATAGIATTLTLTDVAHEGTVIANTEQVICNLSGIRWICADNLVIEGSVPAAGYTVLKLNNFYISAVTPSISWTKQHTAVFTNYWSEWAGTQPSFDVDQTSGRVLFVGPRFAITTGTDYKLTDNGVLEVHNGYFDFNDHDIDVFDLSDDSSVLMNLCSIRDKNTEQGSRLTEHSQFTLWNCSLTRDGSAPNERFVETVFSNIQSSVVYKWDGGYDDGDIFRFTTTDGTTYTPSTDASSGRAIVVTPNGNLLTAYGQAALRGSLVVGTQVWIVMQITLPTFTAGSVMAYCFDDTTLGAVINNWGSAYSADKINVSVPFKIATAASWIGVILYGLNLTGVSGTLKIHSFAVYVGNAAPRVEHPSYPKNIITFNSAAPAAGTWVRGDIVYNNAPAASGTIGWVCTTAGTPGTWKAFGTIAA